jgi:hypothetical protein
MRFLARRCCWGRVVDYVLTSGQRHGARGRRHAAPLQERAENRLTVLGGGRIRGPNVRD